MSELLPWLYPAIALATLAYTVVSARSKANAGKVREIELGLAKKADGKFVGALADKVDELEDRATRIEAELEHLPNKDTAHKIEISLAALQGEVSALKESLRPVAAMADRIQEAMIDQVKFR